MGLIKPCYPGFALPGGGFVLPPGYPGSFPGQFGEHAANGCGDPWFRGVDAAAISALVACYFDDAPDEVYHPGVPAAGPITGGVAGNVLSPVTTPLYRQVLTGLGDDPLGVGFNQGTTDSFDAANSTIHDYNSSLAILTPYIVTGALASFRSMYGKIGNGNTRVYRVFADATTITGQFLGTGGGPTAVIPLPTDYGTLHYLLNWYSASNAEVGLTADTAEQVTAAATPGTYSNDGIFSIGQMFITAGPFILGPMVFWSGPAAENVIDARGADLSAWAYAAGI